MLNLGCINNATEEDKKNELDVWARLFKADTWEELKMMADNYDFAKEAASSIYAVSADEAIRLQCEARERYERDWASSYTSGFEDGVEEGAKREKKRADEAEQKMNEAEQKYNEAELKLDETSKKLEEALKEIELLKAGDRNALTTK